MDNADIKNLGDISNIRAQNNIHWMAILAIALEADPVRTRAALRKINQCDEQISERLMDLAHD